MIDKEILSKAIDLSLAGEPSKAEELFKALEKEEPDNGILMSAMGLFYAQIKDTEKACSYLQRAVNKNKTSGNLSALGFCEFELGNYDKVSDVLEEALNYGESEEIYDKLISSLFEQKIYSKAVKYSKLMYEKYPAEEKAVAHIVKAYTHEGNLQKAEKICVEYLKENLNSALLWVHLGILKELVYGDNKQAYECFKKSFELGYLPSLYQMAVSCQRQKKYEEAEAAYKKDIEIFPQSYASKTSYGMCLLEQKKFFEGYKYFFKRDKSFYRQYTNNEWHPGEPFEKNITLICDQGFGDNIQFIRYLPFLKEKTENITVAVRKPLIKLFERNYSYAKFVELSEINSNEQSVFVTDLAYALGMDFEHIPYSGGYLKSDKADIKSDKLKVGICWEAGSAGIRTMLDRTINIKLFDDILKLDGVQFYSFQVDDTLEGNKKYPQMINLAKDFNDFEDTAKALSAMDLVITVDTALAHLSGALGLKTLLLLPYITDWRWFNDTKNTPWYDSIEIFKQVEPISWEKPLKDIECALKEYSL